MKEEKQRKREGDRDGGCGWGGGDLLSVDWGVHALTDQQCNKWVHNYTAWHPLVEQKETAKRGGSKQFFLFVFLISEENPPFVSAESLFNTFSFIITSYSVSVPTSFPVPSFFLVCCPRQQPFHISKAHGDIPVGANRNVGMMCCAQKCQGALWRSHQ